MHFISQVACWYFNNALFRYPDIDNATVMLLYPHSIIMPRYVSRSQLHFIRYCASIIATSCVVSNLSTYFIPKSLTTKENVIFLVLCVSNPDMNLDGTKPSFAKIHFNSTLAKYPLFWICTYLS